MCGIAGFLAAEAKQSDAASLEVLKRMADAIVHRGPDSDGYWSDEISGVGLAHRRLAIVDLSSAGIQPMVSAGGRYVIVFNGEIYNHLRLRDELRRDGCEVVWRGHSDTETLLACFGAWGVERTLQRSIGMFAIALWDREQRALLLARDRLGEKPLYYGWQGSGNGAVFLFGSELSALRRHPAFAADIDRDALALFLRHNYIGNAHSVFQGIRKLLPGHILRVSAAHPVPTLQAWWSGLEVARRGIEQPFSGTPDEAVGVLGDLLSDAIGLQMMADVPLGAFLSGGIDSSLVVALMQMQSRRPVKTFSIGFHEQGYDEAIHAKAVARHLGTEHTELYVSAEQAMAVIPRLPTLYSEPFSDSSQIPTFLVSQLARQHVTVSLSGDAGDELFGGYTRYQMTARWWRQISRIPLPLRRLASGLLSSVPPRALDLFGARMGDRLHKGSALLGSRTGAELYRGMVSHWGDPTDVVLGAREPDGYFSDFANQVKNFGEVEYMMALDMVTYLPDDILAKVDRAAMGVSLEARVPLLDHRVVEFAWSLPLSFKLRNGVTKWPLREILYRHVPKALMERPKMGFGVPIGNWLRGPLRDWAAELLDPARLANEGYFNPSPIATKWKQHQSGVHNWQYHLWDVLMFQGWLESTRSAGNHRVVAA